MEFELEKRKKGVYRMPGAPMPVPMPWRRLASWGYFSWTWREGVLVGSLGGKGDGMERGKGSTSSCVRVASA